VLQSNNVFTDTVDASRLSAPGTANGDMTPVLIRVIQFIGIATQNNDKTAKTPQTTEAFSIKNGFLLCHSDSQPQPHST
jgi:hypothetical protein